MNMDTSSFVSLIMECMIAIDQETTLKIMDEEFSKLQHGFESAAISPKAQQEMKKFLDRFTRHIVELKIYPWPSIPHLQLHWNLYESHRDYSRGPCFLSYAFYSPRRSPTEPEWTYHGAIHFDLSKPWPYDLSSAVDLFKRVVENRGQILDV